MELTEAIEKLENEFGWYFTYAKPNFLIHKEYQKVDESFLGELSEELIIILAEKL